MTLSDFEAEVDKAIDTGVVAGASCAAIDKNGEYVPPAASQVKSDYWQARRYTRKLSARLEWEMTLKPCHITR